MRFLPLRGRAVPYDPPNRYETVHREMDPAHQEGQNPRTEFLADASRSILSRNRSPDLSFDASVNPYRGCEHGCVYCYARPTHEFLGFSSGLDFERKILVKHRAPELLKRALSAPSWQPRVIAISGVTDAYQPAERRFLLTRRCLEILRDFRNPVSIITKNHLVTRDLDILREMSAYNCVHVTISITSLRNGLQRVMEPRTSIPAKRLDAVRRLSSEGIPVGINVAPVIPGLTDQEMPAILEAGSEAGARYAGFLLLRLPFPESPTPSGTGSKSTSPIERTESWVESGRPGEGNWTIRPFIDASGEKVNTRNSWPPCSGLQPGDSAWTAHRRTSPPPVFAGTGGSSPSCSHARASRYRTSMRLSM